MSESVEILISADDQASEKFAAAAAKMEKSSKRVESILDSLKSPADKYNAQLEELAKLQKEGAISADQFAIAQAKITEKIKGNGNAIKEMGGKAKVSTEFVGTLASTFGSSEIAGFAGQMAGITDKVSKFSDVAKQGKIASLGFKLGLVGLVGTLSFGIGQAIRNAISDTKKLAEEMEAAKVKSQELNSALIAMNSSFVGEQREDIELIRNPDEKKAAYASLLDTLNRDLATVQGNVRAGEKAVKEWSDAWQITGERKESAKMAIADLANDKERLAELTKQRNELMKITSERAAQNKLLAEENAAKDRSESYLQSLRDEVELLQATKEERLAIEAARNTTDADRGEAERLLRERDAILAKQEAEKQLESDRKTADAERARAAEAAIRAAEKEAKIKAAAAKKELAELEAAKQKEEDRRTSELQRIENIKQSEQERLELQRIEIEQGKEAAKVKSLMNRGVDEASARQLAAEEASIEKLKENRKEIEDPIKPLQSSASGGLTASEGRLLTRGPADSDQSVKLLGNLVTEIRRSNKQLATLESIDRNLADAPKIDFAGVS